MAAATRFKDAVEMMMGDYSQMLDAIGTFHDEMERRHARITTQTALTKVKSNPANARASRTGSMHGSTSGDDGGDAPSRPQQRRRRMEIDVDDRLSIHSGGVVSAVPRQSVAKSEATRRLLMDALHGQFLFSTIAEKQLRDVVSVMTREEAPRNLDIIVQGDKGNKCYVLESGAVDVLIGGGKVAELGSGAFFGELALMHNAPRAATIRATEQCVLWALDRQTFRTVLASTASAHAADRIEFLRKNRLLSELSEEHIVKAAEVVRVGTFEAGEEIVRQGEEGETFFMIKEGSVDIVKNGVRVAGLGAGQHFGEMALMTSAPRNATVTATTAVKCYTLDRGMFATLMGPLAEVLDASIAARLLRPAPELERLSDGHLTALGRRCEARRVPAGGALLAAGDVGELLVLKSGRVAGDEEGGGGDDGERHLGFVGSLLEPAAAAITAATDAELLVLRRAAAEEELGVSIEALVAGEAQPRRMSQLLWARAKNAVRATGALHSLHAAVTSSSSPDDDLPERIAFDDLELLRPVGRGSFGTVKMARHKPTGRIVTAKCFAKAEVAERGMQRSVFAEKQVLESLQHPFVVRYYGSHQSEHELFLITEMLQGGDLFTALYETEYTLERSPWGGLLPDAARFYVGCITAVFAYMHETLGLAYRDLKPENLLLDKEGYLKVIDFGFAKKLPYTNASGEEVHRSFTMCGTPDYLAPEIVLSKGHDRTVDFWALGVLAYELFVGRTPFEDANQSRLFENIVNSASTLSFPDALDPAAKDFVQRLLNPNPALRLGALKGGVQDIADHKWFQDGSFSFEGLMHRRTTPPYVPRVQSDEDTTHFAPPEGIPEVQPYVDDGTGWSEGF